MTATKFISDLVFPHPDEYNKLNNSIDSVDEGLVESATLSKNISAQINGGSICIFDSTLTIQEQDDVRNSILLAQLAANKKYNRFSASKDWYTFYFSVLGRIGWIRTNINSSVDNITTTVDWYNYIIDNMGSVDETSLAEKGMKAWQYLPISGQGIMTWNEYTVNNNNEIFQIISVNKSDNNDVIMVISAIASQSIKTPNGFLSWTTKYSSNFNSSKSTLNESIYNTVRQPIIDKLKSFPKTLVVNLPLRNQI